MAEAPAAAMTGSGTFTRHFPLPPSVLGVRTDRRSSGTRTADASLLRVQFRAEQRVRQDAGVRCDCDVGAVDGAEHVDDAPDAVE